VQTESFKKVQEAIQEKAIATPTKKEKTTSTKEET
jgi:hypothetical protein